MTRTNLVIYALIASLGVVGVLRTSAVLAKPKSQEGQDKVPAGKSHFSRVLWMSVSVYIKRNNKTNEIGSGTVVRTGEEFFLEVTLEEGSYFYAMAQTDRSKPTLLFPDPTDFSSIRPPGTYRIPDARSPYGDFIFQDAPGNESLLVFASKKMLSEEELLAELEQRETASKPKKENAKIAEAPLGTKGVFAKGNKKGRSVGPSPLLPWKNRGIGRAKKSGGQEVTSARGLSLALVEFVFDHRP